MGAVEVFAFVIVAILLTAGALTLLGEQKKAFIPQSDLLANGSGFAANESKEQIISIKEFKFSKAPELAGLSGFINTERTSVSENKGKVVLIDFWTYSCINCIRTLPYLNSWHSKYSGQGLVIIGVHTPEFDFEKELVNVQDAVEKYAIKYPVALDNDYRTWRAYGNSYWPRKYLIDSDGFIRYDHIGEGGYEETERVIRELLKETNTIVDGLMAKPSNVTLVEFTKIGSPEIYFGHRFIRKPFGNKEGYSPGGTFNYSLPEEFIPNTAYLEGTWKIESDFASMESDEGKILFVFNSKAVNIVAGSLNGTIVDVRVDGQKTKGIDLVNSSSTIKEHRLYNIVMAKYGQHVLEMRIKGKGFQMYTFTFG